MTNNDMVLIVAVRYLNSLFSNSLHNFCVKFDQNLECPRCDRIAKTIYLHCQPQRWCQVVYQLAHEVCHWAIPIDVIKELRWFEETLCELCSLYVLRAMLTIWRNENIDFKTDDGMSYAICFVEYADEQASEVQAFILDDANLASLQVDEYQREKNTYVADHLLSIFETHSELWNAVPKLCDIRNFTSFHDAIKEWIFISPPECKQGLREVENVLFNILGVCS